MEQGFAQSFSGNVNSTIVSGSYNNTTVNLTASVDERSRLLSWISPLESWKRHQDVSTNRVKGVGDWVLRTAKFQNWWEKTDEESTHKTLLCSGNPGVGKTFVSSLIIDTVCDSTVGSNIGIACLYCDYRGQKEQVPVNMIGSLLRQFVVGLPEIPEELTKAFGAAKRQIGGRALPLDKMLEVFPKVLKSFDRTFIFIDALDEFLVDYRADFLRPLDQIVQQSPNTWLFLTSRPHIHLELGNPFSGPFSVITIQPTLEDVKTYLVRRLENDSEPDAIDEALGSEIVTHITKQHSEIFLLVRLHMEAIMGEVTISGRREKLYQAASDLSDAYSETLDRIKRQPGYKPILGMAVLMWVSLAERPLHVAELRHALAVEIGSKELDIGKVPSIQTILSCCLGLVTVDQETSTVRLIHKTLQEHLRTHPDIFHNPHATIAEACLTYLNFDSVRELSPTLTAAPAALPLVDYASSYWGKHFRKEFTECAKSLALGILKQCPEHVAANIFILNAENLWDPGHYSGGFNGLHYAASLGIQELVGSLIDMGGHDLNHKDFKGRTPLILAAKNGHEEVVEILLGRDDVNVNATDNHGQSPLSWAANNGYERVVMILLGRDDINVNAADSFGQTPLGWAAKSGHEGALKVLLNRTDVSPSVSDMDGRIPLFWAASNGHEGVVKILLDRTSFTLNMSDNYRQSPLSRAAENGHDGVVKVLLSQADINPDMPDFQGQTPLCFAADGGHEGVVKVLLGRADVNPDATDIQGRTSLFCAAGGGYEGIVKVLLDQDNVNPSIPDKDGRTPLFWAANHGHEAVVKSLLNHPGVNPNTPDLQGRTPVYWALRNGHKGVTNILLDRDDVDSMGSVGNLLYLTSPEDHERVIQVYVDRADFNPNSADSFGLRPLHWAVGRRDELLAKILLGRSGTNPDIPDLWGFTPLMWATKNRHEELVKLLLARLYINPMRENPYGETKFSRYMRSQEY